VYVTIGLFALLSFQSGLVCFIALLQLSRLRRSLWLQYDDGPHCVYLSVGGDGGLTVGAACV
jgi:hypothetical protein